MPAGFFSKAELTVLGGETPDARSPQCGACGLHKSCRSPKMPPYGRGEKRILVIGEAPGQTEDERDKPFVGKAGQRLRNVAKRFGIDLDRDCITTNALRCRPPKNATPTPQQVEFCRPNVTMAIEESNPEVIILLGLPAVKSTIGKMTSAPIDSMTKWSGWQIPSQELNAWICPTFHPSYVEREESPVLDRMFEKHLERAFDLTERPWKTVPDWTKRIEVITSPEEAARSLRVMISFGKPVAFDYECNMLKPDSDDARIICCSVSTGSTTIAFPWAGAAIEEMKVLLKSDIPKYGANIKFEERWTRAILGFGVKNWKHCSVISAHTLDNRIGVSGVKFQAFVRYGIPEYDKKIKPFFGSHGGGGNEKNRIDQVPLPDLLLYCGMDSFIEYKLAVDQGEELDNGS